jgi:glycosyltransferase involved in cell wall biosynthesis
LEWFLKTLDPVRRQALRKDPALYFAVSEAVKKNLSVNYRINTDKIKIVPVGINHQLVMDNARKISTHHLRKILGLGPDTIVVGSVGRIDRRKGSDLYVDVVDIVLKKLSPDAKIAFMWVGDGPERKNITQILQEKGYGDKLRMIGMQENPYPYFNCMDILFTPSRDDPFPRVNLEAGLLGKPIVAFSNSGGSVEFIEDDCGFALPNFDTDSAAQCLIRLFLNPALRKSFGHKASEKVKKLYNIQMIAQNARKIIARHFGI